MKAIVVEGQFGVENLRVVERDEPRVGPGQVSVQMRAVSLNYRDLLMIRGHYNPRQPLPLIPCSDGVGEVVEVGQGVERVSVGDRVAPIFAQGWMSGAPDRAALRTTLGGPLDGVLCERRVLDAEGVVKVPAHLSDEEAACLPCAAVTAWSALVELGGISPGQVVLVQGTGGVSIFALQIARAAGARVIVTSSSDEKLARAMMMGASAGINYASEPAWGKAAADLAGGDGVDLVVEVGGAGTLEQSLKAVRPGGTIAMIGILSGGASKINIVPVLMQQIRVQGVIVGPRAAFERMNAAFELHAIKPVIDSVFEFEEAPEALARMASGGHFGKIVVRLGRG